MAPHLRLGLAAAAALLVLPARARADAESDKALAIELFSKGNKKMDAGKCDQPVITDRASCEEAREHFQKAYEIYPAGLGALRNLAYVERGLGRTASAARRFRELEQQAPKDPNPKRHVWAEYARKELEVLEPLIPHLTVTPPSNAPAGLSITLDGKPLPQPAWGTSMEVDPGPHVVRAEATDRAPFESNVTLAEKESKSVAIVFDEKAPPPPPKDEPAPSASRSRVAPLVVAGVGAVTVIVGLGFGYAAISGKQDACGDGKLCEPKGLDDANSYATTSNILTGVGAAVLVGGAVWYFLTPRDEPQKTGVHFAPFAAQHAGGGMIMGRFE